tara:strand:+ start:2779 stop:3162 length:384 start_codon:yes stop_codon:yes gene_type:complete
MKIKKYVYSLIINTRLYSNGLNLYSIIILFIVFGQVACTKSQDEPCVGSTECWHHVYTGFRVCPDPKDPKGHIISNIESDTLYEEVDVCEVEDWLNKTRSLDQNLAVQGDSIDIQFKKDHKNTCGCN